MTLTPSELERFWERVDRSDVCWTWVGSLDRYGYGKFPIRRPEARRFLIAHRVAYELEVGPIPSGLQLDHTCNNRACVNPAHLEPVTNAENSRRGVERRDRCRKGHAYSEVGIAWQTKLIKGVRYRIRLCRACATEYQRNYRAAQKTQAQ